MTVKTKEASLNNLLFFYNKIIPLGLKNGHSSSRFILFNKIGHSLNRFAAL